MSDLIVRLKREWIVSYFVSNMAMINLRMLGGISAKLHNPSFTKEINAFTDKYLLLHLGKNVFS